ncbi:MBOAT family O-acyltransferase [Polaromonas sp. LjRoot131]|uniref:MBOAT family O-acyltransferase n=1 Tax=Polaromonas sp. LjRoot131 TaxID=3342262 RepID=UPI003ECEA139
MLFNSSAFLFVFLPLALGTFYLSRRFWPGSEKYILIFFSLVFYGYWSKTFLVLLVLSIALNWSLAGIVLKLGWRRQLLFVGVAANLALLGIFKYANFFAVALSTAGITEPRQWSIILPLAISFFTFHQISYLIDISRGDKHVYNFWDYLFYIVFFPHLIAGPIVRHNEFIYQIETANSRPVPPAMIAQGIALFILGFGKKMLLANPLAAIVDPLFSAGLSGPLSLHDSVTATLSFSLQIYFDFSGYTDMALGLSLMFGYRLPANFNAPYAAASLVDFWRRWHMTLSRFLKDYLYISMGGNRFGYARQMLALLVTMVLGGLWHGANWTFVAWGALHGLGLAVNHTFAKAGLKLPALANWFITFAFVACCFVIFRAETIPHAMNVLAGFFNPSWAHGVPSINQYALLAAALAIAVLGPTSQGVVDELKPRTRASLALSTLAVLSLAGVLIADKNAPFIYFQF